MDGRPLALLLKGSPLRAPALYLLSRLYCVFVLRFCTLTVRLSISRPRSPHRFALILCRKCIAERNPNLASEGFFFFNWRPELDSGTVAKYFVSMAMKLSSDLGDAQPTAVNDDQGATAPALDFVPPPKPQFGALSAHEMNGGKFEFRKVFVPSHRFTPLKEHWMEIYTPVFEQMTIDIRMNLKVRACSRVYQFFGSGRGLWAVIQARIFSVRSFLFIHICPPCFVSDFTHDFSHCPV